MTPFDICSCGHIFGVHQKKGGPDRLEVKGLDGQKFRIPARCCSCKVVVRMPVR